MNVTSGASENASKTTLIGAIVTLERLPGARVLSMRIALKPFVTSDQKHVGVNSNESTQDSSSDIIKFLNLSTA